MERIHCVIHMVDGKVIKTYTMFDKDMLEKQLKKVCKTLDTYDLFYYGKEVERTSKGKEQFFYSYHFV